MIIGYCRKPEEKSLKVRVCSGDKARHNHTFTRYKDGRVKASRLPTDIEII